MSATQRTTTMAVPEAGRASGCLASATVFVLILFIMGAVLGSSDQREPEPAAGLMLPPPTALSAAPTATATGTTAPTPTLRPTATDTPSPTPTDTATPTATPTETATPTPSLTPDPQLSPTPVTPSPTPTAPPLPTPIGGYSRTLKVPILMYHYVSVPPEDADVYRLDLSVTPDNFRAQLAYLAQNGFSTVDLYDLSLAITGQKELPARPVIITLDDGYLDNYTHAFPLLQEFGFQATFFVVTEFIDNGYAGYMTWPMIEEMAAAGMRIESHSRTHPDLREQSREYLVWQMLGSQQTIAAHTGVTPRYFCFPSGQYDDQAIAVLQELDYWGAVITAGGKWHGFDDRFHWTRLRVRNSTTLPEFADLVDPGGTVGGK